MRMTSATKIRRGQLHPPTTGFDRSPLSVVTGSWPSSSVTRHRYPPAISSSPIPTRGARQPRERDHVDHGSVELSPPTTQGEGDAPEVGSVDGDGSVVAVATGVCDGSVGGGLGLAVTAGSGLTMGDGVTGVGDDVGVGDSDGGGEADAVPCVGGPVGSTPPTTPGLGGTRPRPSRGAMKKASSGANAVAGSCVRGLEAGSAALSVGCGSGAAGATLGEDANGPEDSGLKTSPRTIATIVNARRTSSAVIAIATRA